MVSMCLLVLEMLGMSLGLFHYLNEQFHGTKAFNGPLLVGYVIQLHIMVP
jgi:hypothetical protein